MESIISTNDRALRPKRPPWKPLPRRKQERWDSQTGIALLEVLAALILFVVSAALIGGTFHQAVQRLQRMKLQTQALCLAQSVLDQIAAGVLSPQPGAIPSMDPPFDTWTVQLDVQPYSYGVGPISSLSLVRVTVQDPSGQVTVQLSRIFLTGQNQTYAQRLPSLPSFAWSGP